MAGKSNWADDGNPAESSTVALLWLVMLTLLTMATELKMLTLLKIVTWLLMLMMQATNVAHDANAPRK